jgi:hypothetical protein
LRNENLQNQFFKIKFSLFGKIRQYNKAGTKGQIDSVSNVLYFLAEVLPKLAG